MADVHVSAVVALSPHASFDWRAGDAAVQPDAVNAATDWFDAKHHLTGIRHRYLNDAARYSVAASLRSLCRGESMAWPGAQPEQRGVFLGTAVADYAVRQGVDHAVMAQGFSALNTVSAPNISANIAAAQVAIACQARAFSTTLTSPFLSGFEGLFFAAQSLRLGHATAVMAIAAEESLHADDTSVPVMPGAVLLHLQRACAAGMGNHTGSQGIAASCWGHLNKDATAPAKATQRFLDDVARLLQGSPRQTDLVLMRHHTPLSETTSERWQGWLRNSGLVFDQRRETVFPTVGTVAPMLQAARCLTSPRPVLLLAIHQRRYLAFLFVPTHL